MTASDCVRTTPETLEVRAEPRAPVEDPTLGIAVSVPKNGTPEHRLVTIGDSLTQGFMSGAIFRTELSWPATVAYELGLAPRTQFSFPVYEQPDGPGGLPLDLERLARTFEVHYGPSLEWREIVSALRWLQSYMDEIEDYWERGRGNRALPSTKGSSGNSVGLRVELQSSAVEPDGGLEVLPVAVAACGDSDRLDA